MLWKKRTQSSAEDFKFDPETQYAVIRSSICTGEKVFGFRDRTSGTFEEVGLVRNDDDLAGYCARYGISPADVVKFY